MTRSGSREPSVQKVLQLAIAHHQAGRLREAEHCYRQVLQADADNVAALQLLAGIAHQAGRIDECIHFLDKLLAIEPESAEALANRGAALYSLGRFEEALISCEGALALRPGFAEALNTSGAALHELGRYAESVAAYDRALSYGAGHAAAYGNRGNSLLKLERHEEALASYDDALAIAPDFVEALGGRGFALHALRRHEEAIASFDRALALRSDYADALSGRALALMELRRYDEALASFDQALAIQPEFVEALNNRGVTLYELNRFAEAIGSYDRALAVDPHFAMAWANRGYALYELRRHEEALANYDRALAIDPEYAEAQVNQSLCRLATADYERGWAQYQWRWRYAKFESPLWNFSQPLWLGEEDLRGRTILLHAEQGFGDTLQFVRYVPVVAARGATVILQVQPRLKALLSEVDGAKQVLAHGEPLPSFDLHCPLLSLPLALQTRLDTIPARIPYLRVPTDKLQKWAALLGPREGTLVGITWSGNPTYSADRKRSIALERFAAIQTPGIRLVSLQKDLRPGDEERLAARGIPHFGAEQDDFSDAAALVAHMDLIISIDSSIAHLAGALGRPVWVLLPFSAEWRWLVGRDDSPWYPTARLFRQDRIGDWDSVVEAVRRSLGSLVDQFDRPRDRGPARA